jgi:hypothetical protein
VCGAKDVVANRRFEGGLGGARPRRFLDLPGPETAIFGC